MPNFNSVRPSNDCGLFVRRNLAHAEPAEERVELQLKRSFQQTFKGAWNIGTEGIGMLHCITRISYIEFANQ